MKVRIIHNGLFEILQPTEFLLMQPEIIELAGRTSYQSYLGKEITPESADQFIRMILGRRHETVIEHSLMTVRFWDVSRGMTHELVRHRLAAFTQRSTRYVKHGGAGCVIPPQYDATESVDINGKPFVVAEIFDFYLDVYQALLDSGWQPEDARQFLPIGIESEIVASANFREWRHIFKLRTAKDAHWEIRRSMCPLLKEVKAILPCIFGDYELVGECKKGVPYYTREK